MTAETGEDTAFRMADFAADIQEAAAVLEDTSLSGFAKGQTASGSYVLRAVDAAGNQKYPDTLTQLPQHLPGSDTIHYLYRPPDTTGSPPRVSVFTKNKVGDRIYTAHGTAPIDSRPELAFAVAHRIDADDAAYPDDPYDVLYTRIWYADRGIAEDVLDGLAPERRAGEGLRLLREDEVEMDACGFLAGSGQEAASSSLAYSEEVCPDWWRSPVFDDQATRPVVETRSPTEESNPIGSWSIQLKTKWYLDNRRSDPPVSMFMEELDQLTGELAWLQKQCDTASGR